MTGDVQFGDIQRRLGDIEDAIRRQDDWHVGFRQYEADQRTQAERDRAHDRRLKRLEDGQMWIMRGLAGLAFGLVIQIVVLVISR